MGCVHILHHHTASLLQLDKHLLDKLLSHIVIVLLLLLATMLLLWLRVLLLATRVLTLSTVMLLAAVVLLLTTVLLLMAASVRATALVASRRLRGRGRRRGAAALEVDVDAAGVLLGRVLEAELLADALDAGLDLLDVVGRVVALADNDVQVRLAVLLGVADALLENVLGLLDKLAVQVNGIIGDAARRVVLPKDVVRRLLVVLVHLGRVPLALVAQLLGLGAVAALVGLVGL
jgi:hypothetical protein